MTQLDLAVGLEEGAARKETPPRFLCYAQIANLVAILANIGAGMLLSYLGGDGEAPADQPIFYLQPSVYAFSIWLAIYAGEVVFGVWQLFQRQGVASEQLLEAIQAVSLPWSVAHAVTIVWMFLPTTLLRAFALSVVAVSLGIAHGTVAPFDDGLAFYCMNAPITLHFGWATAAALVTWSMVTAEMTPAMSANFAVLVACLVIAATAGVVFGVRRQSALLSASVAWAVVAVGVEHLNPITAERLAKYNQDFGEVGRYMLGGGELLLGGLLVAVAVVVQRRKAR